VTRVLIIAALICVAAAAASSARGGEPSVDTFATFSWTDSDGDTDYFDGQLDSPKEKCVKRRRLVLLRRAQGDEVKVLRGKSDRRGAFRLEREDPGSGRYFLQIKPDRRGETECGGGLSGPLEVTDLEGV
jgi:hypothetical protein